MKTTAIYLGTRIEAFNVVNNLCDIKKIFTTKNSRINDNKSNIDIDIEIINRTNKEKCFKIIEHYDIDLIFSCGFPFILPVQIFKNSKYIINSHPGLLPKYKGRQPIKSAFLKDEHYQGVTLHHMIEEVDSGKIITQMKTLCKNMSLEEIYEYIFSKLEPAVIVSGLKKLNIK
tara:strand:- start:88 stop:606 length:519 start_codon:yes stop_codon:yes gene_type:complete